MDKPKKKFSEIKSNLHPRNRHNRRYDFDALTADSPALKPFVEVNKYGDESINFFDPNAVLALNRALLKLHYQIVDWNIPKDYLCPPVPGRADYVHYVADLLVDEEFENEKLEIPKGKNIKCLDIGVGANCIYPILGIKEYGWSFVGTDIDEVALKSIDELMDKNVFLKEHLDTRMQKNPDHIFYGIVKKEERFELMICNPPFHASAEEAKAASLKKVRNLKGKKVKAAVSNFGGQNKELWTKGGELEFVKKMVKQSEDFGRSFLWFTSLISKKNHVGHIIKALKETTTKEAKVIPMGQGNKTSRIVAWTYHTEKEREAWTQRWTKE